MMPSGHLHAAQFRTTSALCCQLPNPLHKLNHEQQSGGENAQPATRGAIGGRFDSIDRI
jgi:hypothetical protein